MKSYEFNPQDYVCKTQDAAAFIHEAIEAIRPGFRPEFALTLGSGLGDLAKEIDAFLTIPYQHIPGFPQLTVQGHKGEMIIGCLQNVPIIGLSGRKHYYEVAHLPEGMFEVVFPVHVMANLGVKVYFATNAVGGLHLTFGVGELMLVRDHIDFFLPNPLLGPHLDFGNNLYFQPQQDAYDKQLCLMFKDAAICSGEHLHLHDGVLAACTGRTYETAADSRMLRQIGAHAVGMSVIPEVIVATNRGMKTIAVSVFTNIVAADGTNATSHEEVVAILNSAETKARLTKVFNRFFRFYADANGFSAAP